MLYGGLHPKPVFIDLGQERWPGNAQELGCPAAIAAGQVQGLADDQTGKVVHAHLKYDLAFPSSQGLPHPLPDNLVRLLSPASFARLSPPMAREMSSG